MECIGNAVFSKAVSFREHSVYRREVSPMRKT